MNGCVNLTHFCFFTHSEYVTEIIPVDEVSEDREEVPGHIVHSKFFY